MTSTSPISPSGSSTPSIDCCGAGRARSAWSVSGVSTIEMMTVAEKMSC